MTNLRSIPLSALAIALFSSAALFGPAASPAQTAAPPASPVARPAARIVSPIDETQLVTLKGNTHPAANSKNDKGLVSPDLRMTDLILVLSRSPEQQAAFDAFVNSQYDQNSPNFHQWLTPDQVGAQFGPSSDDIATISSWLAGHGFTVNEVTKDHMSIRFSGTAGQVQSAFHTEIHNLLVNGKQHIANMSDPKIPAALAPAIVGVKALHNFFPRPEHHLGSAVTRDASSGKWERLTAPAAAASTTNSAAPAALAHTPLATAKPSAAKPQYPINVSGSSPYLVEDVDPWDFATIYNVLPLWNKSTPIDGTGQIVAIAGTSAIDLGATSATENGADGINDVATFRSYFGLPTNPVNTPINISGNSEPLYVCTDTTGTVPYADNPCGTGDLTENSLDVEWSGSIAKNAQIVLVSSYPSSVSDDTLYDSESYIVNHVATASSPLNGARIMNVSYGECELSNGTAGNVEYYDLWQQAAAEGISVFVAAGDSGSASCDDGYSWAASGLTVSGLASTPWNTAVGGTDFNWCNPDTANSAANNTECTVGSYWSTSAYASTGSSVQVTTAQGYVPEVPWNESCANPLTLKWSQDIADNFLPSYGYSGSSVSNVEQACNFILDFDFTEDEYGDYGLLYYGYPYSYYAYLLDVVGGSGGASNCVAGTASTNSETGEMTGCNTGATSTGATTNPDTSVPQSSLTLVNDGWPKPSWQQASTNNIPGLTSDGVRDLPDVSFFASDGFVSSSAYLICVSALNPGNAACTYSTRSEPYYQEVGGTSVATPSMAGVMALINQKTGTPQGFANPELYKLAATQTYASCSAESVTAGSATCMFNDIDAGPTPSTPYTNAQPCDAADGTPNCMATQTTLGYSDSEYGLGILTGYSATTGFDLATGLGSVNVANLVDNWVSVIGSGRTTVTVSPTTNSVSLGASLNVTVTVASSPTGGTTPTGSVTLAGGGYTSSAETLSSGAYAFTIPAGAMSGGSGGSVTLTATYSGDSNYAPNSGTAGVTVTKLTATVSATPSVVPPTTIESNQTLTVTGTVTGSGATPTGTVTVSYGTTYTSQAATLSSGNYSVTITPNSLPGGTDTLTVNYSGDANYSTASISTSVDVIFFTVLTPAVSVTTAPPATSTIDSGASVLVTVDVTGSGATPGGQVTLSGGGYTSSSAATLVNGVATFTIPANTLNSSPISPTTDMLTAEYLGDADYAQANGTVTLTVAQSAYTISATSPASSLTPGSSTTSTVSVASSTDYSGTVTFTSASCVLTLFNNGSPSGAVSPPTCALTGSGAVTMTGGVAGSTVTYTVSSTSTTTASVSDRPAIGPGSPFMQLAKASGTGSSKAWFGAAGSVAFAALFLFLIPGGARKWSRMLGMVLFIVAVTFAIAGCGGSSGGTSTPTLPTPTVTVTPQSSSVSINSPLTVGVSVTGTAGTATGGVTLSGGGYNSGANAGTLASGSASFTIPANTFPVSAVGSVLLTASYGGSTAYNPSSGTATITVNNVPTSAGTYTFTVTPTSSNPSLAAQPSTTFTVTVN